MGSENSTVPRWRKRKRSNMHVAVCDALRGGGINSLPVQPGITAVLSGDLRIRSRVRIRREVADRTAIRRPGKRTDRRCRVTALPYRAIPRVEEKDLRKVIVIRKEGQQFRIRRPARTAASRYRFRRTAVNGRLINLTLLDVSVRLPIGPDLRIAKRRKTKQSLNRPRGEQQTKQVFP